MDSITTDPVKLGVCTFLPISSLPNLRLGAGLGEDWGVGLDKDWGMGLDKDWGVGLDKDSGLGEGQGWIRGDCGTAGEGASCRADDWSHRAEFLLQAVWQSLYPPSKCQRAKSENHALPSGETLDPHRDQICKWVHGEKKCGWVLVGLCHSVTNCHRDLKDPIARQD